MTTSEATAAFAAFREAVFDDFHLLMRLRRPMERDAYVAEVLATGAARGFAFDDAAVRAALRAGQEAWLTMGADPL